MRIGRRTARVDAPASTYRRTQSSSRSRVRVEAPGPHRDRGRRPRARRRTPRRGTRPPAARTPRRRSRTGTNRRPRAAARVTAASVLPPSTIGTAPLIGCGSECTPPERRELPVERGRASRPRAPASRRSTPRAVPRRCENAAPTAAYSSRCQPIPRPSMKRPSDRRSSVAARLASTAGAVQRRATTTAVPNRRFVVNAAKNARQLQRVGHRDDTGCARHAPVGRVRVLRVVAVGDDHVLDRPHGVDAALLDRAREVAEETRRGDEPVAVRCDDGEADVIGAAIPTAAAARGAGRARARRARCAGSGWTRRRWCRRG